MVRGLHKVSERASLETVVVLDEHKRILYASRSIDPLFGRSCDEVIGKPFSAIVEPQDPEAIPAGATPQTAVGRHRDGGTFQVEVVFDEAVGFAHHAYVAVIRPADDGERASEAIRRERALLKAVVETAVDGIITIDEDGAILTANPAIERIFGYAPSELSGQNVKMLMPSPYYEEHDGYLTNYHRTGERKIIGIGREVHGLRKDGTIFPLDLAVSETATESGTIFTGILRDNSERQRAVEMQIARDAAVQANAAKSEFLSRMSHELRTPLNAVLGFAQLLDMRFEDPKIQHATHSILKAGQHLLNLINEVLDLSRIEAGRLTLSIEPILLRSILSQASDIVQPLAEVRGVSLRLPEPSVSDRYVLADRQRLLQVLINLISNAVKFNRRGGKVEVLVEAVDGARIRLSVRDTGYGIAPRDRSRLFQPFERFGDLAIEGTGLGLALSHRFVDMMQGTLTLVKSSTEGSIFCVELPSAETPYPSVVGSTTVRTVGAGIVLKGKVLYIEDNVSNMQLVEMVLEAYPKIELVPAMQGNVGLELAASHQPDLIYLDLHLPDLPGGEVLRRLKSDPRTAIIPVVVVSADATPSQIRRLRQSGASDYLTKPLDVGQFVKTLEAYLEPLEDNACIE